MSRRLDIEQQKYYGLNYETKQQNNRLFKILLTYNKY